MRGILLIVPALVLASGAALWAKAPAPAADNGALQFRQRCAGCHGDTGWATRVLSRRVTKGQGALESRTDLNPDFVRIAVRSGVGMMPAIRKAELPDAELAAIGGYLSKRKRK